MLKPFLLALALSAMASAASVAAATVVAPNDRADAPGDNPQYLVFGNESSNTSEFQTAFAASQFAAVPVGATITGIGFRVRPNGFARDTSYTDFTIAIGAPAAGYQTLSPVYAANEGADTVTARSGALDLDPETLVTDQAVNPFFTIPFTTPYTYKGGDLLVTTSFVSTGKPELGLDAVNVGGVTKTVGGGTGAGSAGTDNAPIIAFTFAAPSAVPEPATWAMAIGGLGIAGTALRRDRRARPA